MLTRWNIGLDDFDDMFSAMNQLRQYMERVLEDPNAVENAWNARPRMQLSGSWPRANLVDAGASLVLSAEVPGLTEKDIKLSLNQDVLSISGKRTTDAPEGYSVHRQERPSIEFSRSFALPCRINADRTSALVRNGILTVTLEKASDAMPRQIAIKASST